MSKVVSITDLGVPVPAAGTVPTTDSLVMYWGPTGFTPAYTLPSPVPANTGRVVVGVLSGLTIKVAASGGNYYDVPVSTLLPAGTKGPLDFYFTFADAQGDESDFSAVVSEVVPAAPLAPGQPIILQ